MDQGTAASSGIFQEHAREPLIHYTRHVYNESEVPDLDAMRLLIAIFLLVVLFGCAAPFRTVYTSPEGDYYIEESAV